MVGIGTCSDLRGIDFAVFGSESEGAEPFPHYPRQCRGAVLLREAKNSERPGSFIISKNQLVLAVEALTWKTKDNQTIRLAKTGKKKIYIPILG